MENKVKELTNKALSFYSCIDCGKSTWEEGIEVTKNGKIIGTRCISCEEKRKKK